MKEFSFLELVNKLVKNSEELTDEERKYLKNSFEFYLSTPSGAKIIAE